MRPYRPLGLGELDAPFDHPDWIFELKLDGFRCLAFIEGGAVRLVSRNGKAFKSYGPLAAALATEIGVRDAVIDGELVVLDEHGKPNFRNVMRRQPPVFAAFDLLRFDGKDLRDLPLLTRKAGTAPRESRRRGLIFLPRIEAARATGFVPRTTPPSGGHIDAWTASYCNSRNIRIDTRRPRARDLRPRGFTSFRWEPASADRNSRIRRARGGHRRGQHGSPSD